MSGDNGQTGVWGRASGGRDSHPPVMQQVQELSSRSFQRSCLSLDVKPRYHLSRMVRIEIADLEDLYIIID